MHNTKRRVPRLLNFALGDSRSVCDSNWREEKSKGPAVNVPNAQPMLISNGEAPSSAQEDEERADITQQRKAVELEASKQTATYIKMVHGCALTKVRPHAPISAHHLDASSLGRVVIFVMIQNIWKRRSMSEIYKLDAARNNDLPAVPSCSGMGGEWFIM
ncbi:hypothetical protein PM082_010826 [Marasmius tenuissimus]|nr:hypothetical protein PM082_010826 [Marasmius tenuissimus]